MRPGVPSFFPLFIGSMGHLFYFLFWLVFFFINAGFSFYRFSTFWDRTWLVSFHLFMFFILSTPFQAFCVLGARSWLKPQDQQVGRRWFAKFFLWLQVRWKGAGSRGPWCDSPFCKVWFHRDVMWYGWWKKSCTSWYGILPFTPLFTGFHTCEVVQDFFRQQYHGFWVKDRIENLKALRGCWCAPYLCAEFCCGPKNWWCLDLLISLVFCHLAVSLFFQRVFFLSLASLVLKSVKSSIYTYIYTHRFENLVRILGVACDVVVVILPIIGLLCLSYFWGVGKSSQCTTICSYTRNVSLTCKSKVLNIFLNVNVFCLFVVFRFSSFIPFLSVAFCVKWPVCGDVLNHPMEALIGETIEALHGWFSVWQEKARCSYWVIHNLPSFWCGFITDPLCAVHERKKSKVLSLIWTSPPQQKWQAIADMKSFKRISIFQPSAVTGTANVKITS